MLTSTNVPLFQRVKVTRTEREMIALSLRTAREAFEQEGTLTGDIAEGLRVAMGRVGRTICASGAEYRTFLETAGFYSMPTYDYTKGQG